MGLYDSFVIPVKNNVFEKLFSEIISKKTYLVNMIHKPFCEQSYAESVSIHITALNKGRFYSWMKDRQIE